LYPEENRGKRKEGNGILGILEAKNGSHLYHGQERKREKSTHVLKKEKRRKKRVFRVRRAKKKTIVTGKENLQRHY